MTDDEMYVELTRFANECTVARDIDVNVSCYRTSFKPKAGLVGFKHEDAEYLQRLIDGATAYLCWKRRNSDNG